MADTVSEAPTLPAALPSAEAQCGLSGSPAKSFASVEPAADDSKSVRSETSGTSASKRLAELSKRKAPAKCVTSDKNCQLYGISSAEPDPVCIALGMKNSGFTECITVFVETLEVDGTWLPGTRPLAE